MTTKTSPNAGKALKLLTASTSIRTRLSGVNKFSTRIISCVAGLITSTPIAENTQDATKITPLRMTKMMTGSGILFPLRSIHPKNLLTHPTFFFSSKLIPPDNV